MIRSIYIAIKKAYLRWRYPELEKLAHLSRAERRQLARQAAKNIPVTSALDRKHRKEVAGLKAKKIVSNQSKLARALRS